MKRTKVLAYLFNLYSMSAVAGYECVLKLAHMEDFRTNIAEKTVQVGTGNSRSGNFGTLLIESESRNKKTVLDINAVMTGWNGEEDASFVIIRRVKKRGVTVQGAAISQVTTVKGNSSAQEFFDEYKLDIDCKVTE